jgi:hypothetical protein
MIFTIKNVGIYILGTGHKVITRGGWRINKISSTYFHTLPKTYGKFFITPFNLSENFHTPPPRSIINRFLWCELANIVINNSDVSDLYSKSSTDTELPTDLGLMHNDVTRLDARDDY